MVIRVHKKPSPLADNQIAELFGRDVKTIGKHINNALREELAPNIEANDSDREQPHNSTVAKFATVQIEGGREVTRQVEYYNLDVILSVGYRVKSATIYVEHIGRGLQSLQQTARTQSGRMVHLAETRQRVHDRFLIIDDEVYHLGASLNELGKRLFAFSRLQMDKEIIMQSIIRNQ